MDYFGGPVLSNVQVETLFLGQQWFNQPLSQQQSWVNNYLGFLTQSPYMDLLGPYHVGRGSFDKTANESYNNDPFMTESLTDQQVQGFVRNAIGQGWLSPESGSQLYIVFTPPGETVYGPDGKPNTGNWNGYHSSFADGSATIYYAVIPYPASSAISDGANQMTAAISHELAEAVTDAIPYTGWYDPQLQNSPLGGEIGDIADEQNAWSVYWDDVRVQPLVDRNDQVVNPLLPASGQNSNLKSNQLSTVKLGTFQDWSTFANGLSPDSFTTQINWGDGQTSPAYLAYVGGGQYQILGAHYYAKPGEYIAVTSITDPYGINAYTSSVVNVSPPTLNVTPQNFTTLAYDNASETVAAFVDSSTDSAGNPLPGWAYTTTINWGDGQTSAGQVVYDSVQGNYRILGSHNYAQTGSYTVTTTVTDPSGVQANASSTAYVGPPSALVAEFPGNGLWRYTAPSGWAQLTTADATSWASGQNGVVAVFGGAGVYLWNAPTGKWTQIDPNYASQVAINSSNEVVAEFAGWGVGLWTAQSGWVQLSPYDASALAIDNNGSVTAEFPGGGLWLYNSSGSSGAWKQITPFDASLFVESNGYVAAEFPGGGVWLYTPSQNWRQLTAADASALAVDGNGNVFAAFGGAGTYLYQNSSSTWQNMGSPGAARQVGMGAADVLFVELANGLWKVQNGVWYQIDRYSPSQFSVSSSAL